MPPRLAPLEERVWQRVDKNGPLPDYAHDLGPCWLWTGHINDRGYGIIQEGGAGTRHLRAHRVVYALVVGPIPAELEADHLCHTRAVAAGLCRGGSTCPHRRCCNPAHLEPVTRKVNQQRGFGPCGINSRKTHCPQGHAYSEDGVCYEVRTGGRRCRICNKVKAREYRARKKEEVGRGR